MTMLWYFVERKTIIDFYCCLSGLHEHDGVGLIYCYEAIVLSCIIHFFCHFQYISIRTQKKISPH